MPVSKLLMDGVELIGVMAAVTVLLFTITQHQSKPAPGSVVDLVDLHSWIHGAKAHLGAGNAGNRTSFGNCSGYWVGLNCSASCGGGFSNSTFTFVPSSNATRADTARCALLNGSTVLTPCNTQSCDANVNCRGHWVNSTECSKSCDKGTWDMVYEVYRPAVLGGKQCVFANGSISRQFCNLQPCDGLPRDCVGEWLNVTECSASCGTGIWSLEFSVYTTAFGGGQDCPFEDEAFIEESCDLQPCSDLPRDCVAELVNLTQCSASCGAGSWLVSYEINATAWAGGKECKFPDKLIMEQFCFLQSCDTNCTNSTNSTSNFTSNGTQTTYVTPVAQLPAHHRAMSAMEVLPSQLSAFPLDSRYDPSTASDPAPASLAEFSVLLDQDCAAFGSTRVRSLLGQFYDLQQLAITTQCGSTLLVVKCFGPYAALLCLDIYSAITDPSSVLYATFQPILGERLLNHQQQGRKGLTAPATGLKIRGL